MRAAGERWEGTEEGEGEGARGSEQTLVAGLEVEKMKEGVGDKA